MFSSIILTLLGGAIVVVLVKWLKIRHTINKIPGTADHPIFGVLLEFLVPPDEIWRTLRRISTQSYPISKHWYVTVPIVCLLSPEDIEIVLSSTKHLSKSISYDVLHSWLGSGLLTSAGSKWQQRRKVLTPTFHFNILQQFIPIFVEESELLVRALEKECDASQTDVVPFVAQFTLNSICQTAMGIRLDQTRKSAKEYATAIAKLGEILVHRLLRPWILKDFPFFIFSPMYWKQRKLLKTLHGFTQSVIKKREAEFKESDLKLTESGSSRKKRLAMLDLLISAKRVAHSIDDEGIREEVDTFMFEGHDTTTACICFTLLMLACHEDIQGKVVEELQEVFHDTNRSPTYQDLQNMQYLEMVIKESLRMYPSVHFISRVAGEDIQTFTGYTIPANTVIQIHIYDVHHSPHLYPEPEKFDPDRFSAENVAKRHPFAYLPFSAGPRNCIGQKFAMLEIKTVLAAILRRFVLKPVDFPENITLITHIVLRSQNGVKVKFERRQK